MGDIWKQTRTGKAFRPLGDGVDDICIEDIASALSRICRYTGHCREHYSVAEHCFRVSLACDPADAFAGLMHDAAEAYVGDVSQPLKMAMRAIAADEGSMRSHYDELEKRVERRVAEKFGLTLPWPASVKRADLVLLATEARDLMVDPPMSWNLPYPPLEKKIVPLTTFEAECVFVARFYELDAERARKDLAVANACLASVMAQRKAWRSTAEITAVFEAVNAFDAPRVTPEAITPPSDVDAEEQSTSRAK